ncbi:MAG: inositol monophosphatase [Chloroflexi bacterium]|jgi:myo-inositol-1(or 4)-monophosphatase|nr:inositol monophosphatase family protein [Anaerolineaceae bacterium]NMB91179.1 inositol monophosphatase [Chloroflexota bacterium]
MQPTLDIVKTWAAGAGSILREGHGKQHQVRHKGVIDIVSEIDQRSEAYLIDQIRSHFPDHSLFTEETGMINGEQEEHRWFIDPLDGTVNYVHGIPIFSVSIGYAYRGELQLGVVYDPMRDHCFSAAKGQGAFLNDEPIHVASTEKLIDALTVTGFPYDMHGQRGNNLDHYTNFAFTAQAVRRLGSAALDLCYIACGWFDGYWEMEIKPYDFAAGTLMVREAGGVVTTFRGDPDVFHFPYTIVAANPVLHPQMLEVIQSTLDGKTEKVA